MKLHTRWSRWAVAALVLATACNLPAAPTSTPAASVGTATKPAAPITQQAEHRIGVRQVDGVGEFYDKQSGAKFVPRGANYVHVPLGNGHTIMLLKVGLYDGQQTRNDFKKLAGLGYNTVRVFLDHCNKGAGCIGASDNQGLNPKYIDNIADMMLAAREAGIFILFCSNDLPDQGGYSEQANQGSGGNFAGYRNSYYLRPQAVTATRRYWSDLLTGLVDRGAAFDTVLGWELLNEQWMFADQPPLSLTSGSVTTTTGTYDMSSPAQKKQMVSDGLVYYIAQMKEEILKHDPTALVDMGFFAPDISSPEWYVETASLLQKADLDFFDFHAYPGAHSLAEDVQHFGMTGYKAKPIIMGEYGAFRSNFPDITAAARTLGQWVAESCKDGFGGWLYWDYYPADPSAGDQTWGMVDDKDYLLNLFAPVNQPDPCVAPTVEDPNIAFGKEVTASRSLPDQPPSAAVDENSETLWGAGDGPVQWIQVDLGAVYRISEIRLQVSQYPAGRTTHKLQVRGSDAEAYHTVQTFSSSTSDTQWLDFKPAAELEGVRQIRVETTLSPSWVAWREIQVYGQQTIP